MEHTILLASRVSMFVIFLTFGSSGQETASRAETVVCGPDRSPYGPNVEFVYASQMSCIFLLLITLGHVHLVTKCNIVLL